MPLLILSLMIRFFIALAIQHHIVKNIYADFLKKINSQFSIAPFKLLLGKSPFYIIENDEINVDIGYVEISKYLSLLKSAHRLLSICFESPLLLLTRFTILCTLCFAFYLLY